MNIGNSKEAFTLARRLMDWLLGRKPAPAKPAPKRKPAKSKAKAKRSRAK